MVKLTKESFYKYKRYLDSYVFYIINENDITIKQVIPDKEITKLINNLKL